MKVLHITPSYEPAWELGGVVRAVSSLCRGLARLGVDVTVFTTDRGNNRRLAVPVNRMLELGGVKVWYFRADYSLKFAYSRALYAALKSCITEFDLLNFHAFWCYPGIVAGIEARKQRIPYIVFTHGTIADYALAHKPFKKKIYMKLVEERNLRQASALCYTVELEREMTASLGLSAPSFVIPNGVEPSEFRHLPDKQQAKEKWGLPTDSQPILYLGRLVQGKSLQMLLEAFTRVAETLPRAYLVLAGPDQGLKSTLMELAARLKVESRVIFTGYVKPEKRNSLLRAAEVLALVSQGENFGYTAVEAMMTGLPVLVSEKVGISREITADRAGLVIPLHINAIAKALMQMLSAPKKLKTMGRAAAAAARRRYDIKVVAQMMATAYEDILSGRRTPGLGWSDG